MASKLQSFPQRHCQHSSWPNWAEEQGHPRSSKGTETASGWTRWISLSGNSENGDL